MQLSQRSPWPERLHSRRCLTVSISRVTLAISRLVLEVRLDHAPSAHKRQPDLSADVVDDLQHALLERGVLHGELGEQAAVI